MGKEELCYLDIYQTPVKGTAIAIFHNGNVRRSLDNILNAHASAPFSLVGNKAFALYHRAMEGTRATNRFFRDFYPEAIEKIIKRIEGGAEPNEILKLAKTTDVNYDPYRSKFSIIETTKKEEKPKDTLRRIFTVYPILAIPKEDPANLNLAKNKELNELLLYDISEESLRSGYENGVFEIKEGNGPQVIIGRKKDGLLHLYTDHDFKLAAALRKATFKASIDPSQELMDQIKLIQDDYARLKEEYDKTVGKNSELEIRYNQTVQTSIGLAKRLAERDQLSKDVDSGNVDVDIAEERSQKIFGKWNKPQIVDLGGGLLIGHNLSAEEANAFAQGDDPENLFKKSLGQTSKGEGKDKTSTV